MGNTEDPDEEKTDLDRQAAHDRAAHLFTGIERAKAAPPEDEVVVRALLGAILEHAPAGCHALLRVASDGRRTLDELIEAGDWQAAREVLERLVSGTYQ